MSAELPHPDITSPKKSKWTADEDEQLRNAVCACGTDSWNRVAIRIPTRTGKQCRERWIGQLAPTVVKDVWLAEEDEILIRSHSVFGNRWTAITVQLPGRSALSIKNRWHWLQRHNATQETAPAGRIPMMDIVERARPCRALFEPMALDGARFGPAFEEFRAKMFLGAGCGVNL
jgi:hypothetical protein